MTEVERHPDPVDQATALAELERAAAATLRFPTLKRTGHCYNCGEELPNPAAVFCGIACRDDYEIQEKRQRRAGVSVGRVTISLG